MGIGVVPVLMGVVMVMPVAMRMSMRVVVVVSMVMLMVMVPMIVAVARRSRADALHVMVVAFLRQADLGLEPWTSAPYMQSMPFIRFKPSRIYCTPKAKPSGTPRRAVR
jgi:hypothetical protein